MPLRNLVNVTVTTAIITLVLAGCGAGTAPEIAGTPESIAKQVAADFLSIPATDISLVSITPQEFNDSSLDCPEPGMSYLQVLTAGHRAIVEADGRRFDVRVSGSHGRICRRNKVQPPGSSAPPRSDIATLIDLARQDLARHLATEAPDIQVLEIKPVNAREVVKDCSPDCGDSLKQCGYMIALMHDGRRYDYHADRENVAPCPPILKM